MQCTLARLLNFACIAGRDGKTLMHIWTITKNDVEAQAFWDLGQIIKVYCIYTKDPSKDNFADMKACVDNCETGMREILTMQ